MHVLVTGGTGFVGNILVNLFCARGDRVTVVTRSPETARTARVGVAYERMPADVSKYEAIVHLAGEPIVGKRWNAAQKARLRASRVETTTAIVDAIARASKRPRILVCASAVGYFGSRGDEVLTEGSAPGTGFLAELCVEWERAARGAEASGARVVPLRIGIVLGKSGGALKSMLPIFRLGLGGPLGSARSWFPWIHVNDLGALILFAIDDERARGPIHATSPGIVRQGEFARTLGRVLGRPAILPAPRFALRLALGEVATALTASQRCVPERASALGFTFQHAQLEPCLRQILGRN